jgi:hypothetical protein
VVISFIKNNEVRLYRILQDQSIAWEQTVVTQPPATYMNQLLPDGADGFYLVFGFNSLWARRYNYQGQQLWPAEIQIGTGTISGLQTERPGGLRMAA